MSSISSVSELNYNYQQWGAFHPCIKSGKEAISADRKMAMVMQQL